MLGPIVHPFDRSPWYLFFRDDFFSFTSDGTSPENDYSPLQLYVVWKGYGDNLTTTTDLQDSSGKWRHLLSSFAVNLDPNIPVSFILC